MLNGVSDSEFRARVADQLMNGAQTDAAVHSILDQATAMSALQPMCVYDVSSVAAQTRSRVPLCEGLALASFSCA